MDCSKKNTKLFKNDLKIYNYLCIIIVAVTLIAMKREVAA